MAGFNDAWAECEHGLMDAFGESAVFWTPGLDASTDPPSGECLADLIENYQAMDSEGYPRVLTVIDLPDLLMGGVKPERDLRVKVAGRVYRLLQLVKRDRGLESWEVV